MVRTNQGLWVGGPLSSWQDQCGGRRPKPQTSMQPSHSPVSLFLLWSQRTESPSCSTWLNNIAFIPTIKEDVIATQGTNVGMSHLRWRLELGEAQYFWQDADGVLWFKDHLVVRKELELHHKTMDEAHCLRYSIHPGTNKMYQDLKKNFWWTRMKREIAKYVFECDTCRRVKADHLRPAGNLQPLSISEWKWENICIDFIVGLPNTLRGYNSIWVIMDRLTKSAHSIPVSTTYRVR
jgi:hypothetical protein